MSVVLLAMAMTGSLSVAPAQAAPDRSEPTGATQAAAPLTNLAHLDFLTDRVAVQASAAHTTYRLASEPTVGVLWVYADCPARRHLRPGRRRRL